MNFLVDKKFSVTLMTRVYLTAVIRLSDFLNMVKKMPKNILGILNERNLMKKQISLPGSLYYRSMPSIILRYKILNNYYGFITVITLRALLYVINKSLTSTKSSPLTSGVTYPETS